MAKLPTVTSTQLIVVLQKLGFKFIRQKGSHLRLKDQDN
ncbi:type II toxin-antitoxin system HicA family toxin [Synechocystis sp. PCC 7339]